MYKVEAEKDYNGHYVRGELYDLEILYWKSNIICLLLTGRVTYFADKLLPQVLWFAYHLLD